MQIRTLPSFLPSGGVHLYIHITANTVIILKRASLQKYYYNTMVFSLNIDMVMIRENLFLAPPL